MNRLRCFGMAAFCLAVLTTPAAVWSAPAPVERSGLDQVPATAPIVVHVRGAQGTRDRLVAMMEKALPDVLAKFQPQMDDALKNGVQGRKLRGLVKDGPIFFVFTELPKPGDNPPKLAIILAVTNYKEFRDGLLTEEEQKNVKENNGVENVTIERETVYFVDRKGYAVVTPNEDVATSFTKKQPGLNGKMSKEQAAKLMNSDAGVYVAVDALNKEYAEQIKQGRQMIEQGLDFGLAQATDKSQKSALELAKSAIGPIFQAIEDSQGVLLTAEFRPGGLALHMQSEVREGSPTGQLLQDAHPVAFKELARMPEGKAYYMGMKTSSALLKGVGNLVAAASKDKQEGKAMAEALDEFAKAKPDVRLDAASFPPAGLQVYQCQDPAKAVAAQLKIFKAMEAGGTVATGTLKERPVIKESAQKHGDVSTALGSVRLGFRQDGRAGRPEGRGDQKAVHRGDEGYFGRKDDHLVRHRRQDARASQRPGLGDRPEDPRSIRQGHQHDGERAGLPRRAQGDAGRSVLLGAGGCGANPGIAGGGFQADAGRGRAAQLAGPARQGHAGLLRRVRDLAAQARRV